MADITGNTFVESALREKVIFQRGKDVLDSELNELQDILRVGARRAFSDVYGDGYILETEFEPFVDGTTHNTVFIRAGRFYVDGYRVQLLTNYAITGANYTASNPPSGLEVQKVYLKLTEIEVSGIADPTIINSSLGSETTRRVAYQTEFFVGYSVPSDTMADLHQGGTKYRLLSTLNRRATDPVIVTGDLVDERKQVAIGTIREEMRSFLTGGGTVTWDLTGQNLSWSSALKIRIPGKAYSFLIAPTTLSSFVDGSVAYATLNADGGTIALTVAANAAVPQGEWISPVVIREGNNIYFRFGALDLAGSSTSTSSGSLHDLPAALLTFIGSSGETDANPNYPSAHVVSQGASLTAGVGALDAAVYSLLNVNPDEEHQVATGGQTIFNASTISWNASQSICDIQVFVDGRFQPQDKTGLLTNPIYAFKKTSGSQITFVTGAGIQAGSVISIYLVRPGAIIDGGGIQWDTPVNASIVPDTGNLYDVGSGSFMMRNGYFAGKLTVLGGIDPSYIQLTPQTDDTAIPNNSLWVDQSDSYKVKLKNASAVSFSLNEVDSDTFMVKTMQSSDSVTIPQGAPVSKQTDGSILRSSAVSGARSRFVGFAAQAITAGSQGIINLVGYNNVGALTGIGGFAPGDEVFLSETTGLYANSAFAFTDSDDVVRVGIADCSGGAASSTVNDIISAYDVVSRAPV